MCGRYTLTTSPEAIRALFAYAEQPNFPARYNIAPTQPIGIVRLVDGKRHFALVRWGLLPSWVKDPKAFSLIINARGESVADKPAFRAAMKRRRCLIPADGFYEWMALPGQKSKQPMYIRLKGGELFAFAGLYVQGPSDVGETCVIVTTAANEVLAPIHNRMPVILPRDLLDAWLDPSATLAEIEAMLGPAPEASLRMWPVSTEVNRVAADGAHLLRPIELPATLGLA